MVSMLMTAIRRLGMVLPNINWMGQMGVTKICWMVSSLALTNDCQSCKGNGLGLKKHCD